MPWHDIGMQHRGDSVIDSVRHFIQYWYFVSAEAVKDPYQHGRNLQKRYDQASSYVGVDWDEEEGGYNLEKRRQEKKITRKGGCANKVRMCGTKTKLFLTGT